MSNRWVLAASLTALILGVWLFYSRASWASRSGDSAPLYSSTRYDPYGTAALYELLALRGVTVQPLLRPHLRRNDHGTLLQILALHERSLSNDQPSGVSPEELIPWMSEGNTVIQLTRDYTALMRALSIPPGQASGSGRETQSHELNGKDPAAIPGVVVRDVSRDTPGTTGALELIAPRVFGDKEGPHWRALAWAKDGILVGERRVGRGRLIVVGAPTPALNGWLDRGGNLRMILNLCGGGPVILDEWSHGVGQQMTVLDLVREAGLTPVLLQILYVLGIYHWSTRGYRRIDESVVRRRRSSSEQIQTLAYLYSRSLPDKEMRQRIEQELRGRLAHALRCQPGRLEAKIQSLKPREAAQVQPILTIMRDMAALREGRRAEAVYAGALTQSHYLVRNYKREH